MRGWSCLVDVYERVSDQFKILTSTNARGAFKALACGGVTLTCTYGGRERKKQSSLCGAQSLFV